jgi:hypothetical protein
MSDYSILAQRVSLSITGVRGCLMLSRDGMLLGAHPEGEAEAHLRSAWVRFAGVGDPERSYVEFPDQIWAFVRRGGYAAFAVADVGVRPGVLVDLLEQALMAGEQDRAHDRETMRLPEVPSAPSGKPRTSLHKPERPATVEPEPVIVASEASDAAAVPEVGRPDATQPAPEAAPPPPGEPDPPDAGPADEREPAAPPEPSRPVAASPEAQEGKEDESEVDRILLAKEFAGLLQVPKEDDEASR